MVSAPLFLVRSSLFRPLLTIYAKRKRTPFPKRVKSNITPLGGMKKEHTKKALAHGEGLEALSLM